MNSIFFNTPLKEAAIDGAKMMGAGYVVGLLSSIGTRYAVTQLAELQVSEGNRSSWKQTALKVAIFVGGIVTSIAFFVALIGENKVIATGVEWGIELLGGSNDLKIAFAIIAALGFTLHSGSRKITAFMNSFEPIPEIL